MSMPSKVIYCDKCDHSTGDIVLFGDHFYLNSKGDDVLFCPKLGWCNSCTSLVPIENLTVSDVDFESLDKLTFEAKEAEVELKASLFKRLFTRKWWLEDRLENLSKEVRLLAIKQKRQGREKCLECGSGDIERMDLDAQLESEPWPASYKGFASTGHLHPGCGGEFMVKGSEMRLMLAHVKRYFTEEGELIREEK